MIRNLPVTVSKIIERFNQGISGSCDSKICNYADKRSETVRFKDRQFCDSLLDISKRIVYYTKG